MPYRSAKFIGPMVVVFLVIAGGVAYVAMSGSVAPGGFDGGGGMVACTQEAMICPDGSAVGRTGPDCAFASCPGGGGGGDSGGSAGGDVGGGGTASDCSGPGGSCARGYTCIERCGPPVARENDPPPGYYCERDEIAAQPRMCPICLASNTMIATPEGEVNVKELAVGAPVWSQDGDGNRIVATVARIGRTHAPADHEVVHLVLADGREVWVSPNHPLWNDALVGDLRAGDDYDGSAVTVTERVAYWDKNTYDLLPDSETGVYWANGILLGSTLEK